MLNKRIYWTIENKANNKWTSSGNFQSLHLAREQAALCDGECRVLKHTVVIEPTLEEIEAQEQADHEFYMYAFNRKR